MFTITIATADSVESYDVYGDVNEAIDLALHQVEGASDAISVTLRKDGLALWVANYANGDCVDYVEYAN